ncbi:MAG: hypothetical protein K0R41_115 [Geminicoccaceae bacterium]|nr:hypothetical protein [Solirubrobacterales bacterium]MCE3246290.1 hypothetical protein [Geminicoccaceae bacterium]
MATASSTAGTGRAARRALGLLAAGALGLAACGEGDGGEAAAGSEVEGVGPVRTGSTAQLASCRDWRRGTEEQRYATLADIRGQLTEQTDPEAVSDLPDEAAYAMFEKVCATGYSDSLRLYKLYGRAEAYAPLRTDLDSG